MTLNHSKTWPVNTFAVVQLRVDLQGRTYDTVAKQEALSGLPRPKECPTRQNRLKYSATLNENFKLKSSNDSSEIQYRADIAENANAARDDKVIIENGVVLPLSEKHLELFTKMSSAPRLRTTVRTDTISTLLDPTEFECERTEDAGNNNKPEENNNPEQLQKFHVLALTRIEENVDEGECHVHRVGRRPSIKVDNWDFIYTETLPNTQVRLAPIK
ncbi:hypothetical protein NQ318_018340 [Aromia moschata]|uniref:Uncharacterized protein n=1 Tax=Aromia moschata TaxID=1265417 RepID=A0AAV8ZF76_9CUCU|nr:hypothetical protein NQ318_018340 [Aromia moschata]